MNPTTMAEELSESNSSSNSSSSSGGGGGGGHSEALLPGFHPYKGLEDLQTGGCKLDEDPTAGAPGQRFGEYEPGEMPIALDKPKDYAVQRTESECGGFLAFVLCF